MYDKHKFCLFWMQIVVMCFLVYNVLEVSLTIIRNVNYNVMRRYVMSEIDIIQKSKLPVIKEQIVEDLRKLGLKAGDVVLVHSAVSKIGWVVGKQVTVIEALLEVLGEEGTLVMPSFSGDSSDPINWKNPPVPENWIEIIHNHMPAFDARTTPTRGMGCIADAYWHYPGVKRSNHPHVSFSARGKLRDMLISEHPLTPGFGKQSPLYKLYENDAKVLLLGVSYGNCTCIHLAEMLQEKPRMEHNGAPVLVDNKRQWVAFDEIAYDDSDFEQVGSDFEKEHSVTKGNIGLAPSILLNMREITDFSVTWIKNNRKDWNI